MLKSLQTSVLKHLGCITLLLKDLKWNLNFHHHLHCTVVAVSRFMLFLHNNQERSWSQSLSRKWVHRLCWVHFTYLPLAWPQIKGWEELSSRVNKHDQRSQKEPEAYDIFCSFQWIFGIAFTHLNLANLRTLKWGHANLPLCVAQTAEWVLPSANWCAIQYTKNIRPTDILLVFSKYLVNVLKFTKYLVNAHKIS